MTDLQRLTQPDWCNDPQPYNWHNACMRPPGHAGEHAVRKSYRRDEAFSWESGRVHSVAASHFPDLWDLEAEAGSEPEATKCRGQSDFSDEFGQGTNPCRCTEYVDGKLSGWCRTCGHSRATHGPGGSEPEEGTP